MRANSRGTGNRGCAVLVNLLTLLVFGLILIVIAVAVAAFGAPDLISQLGEVVGLEPPRRGLERRERSRAAGWKRLDRSESGDPPRCRVHRTRRLHYRSADAGDGR